jgi:colanic acid/amylovoran biosynthesis glycosyltransferase
MPGVRVAYILLWFPEPTQTFILDEVNTMHRLGLEVEVHTLYGPRPPAVIAGMSPATAPVSHLGTASLGSLIKAITRLPKTWGPEARRFCFQVLGRRWRSLETAGEAWWATLAGVYLAERYAAAGIGHIHAPWADGPATAAWVASRLSGIPFSFCCHAHDIYPPDGALQEKLEAATFVRTISTANELHLTALAPAAAPKLVKIPYGSPLAGAPAPPRLAQPPYQMLAIGRFVAKKGFPVLLAACRQLAGSGLDFRLTLAGDGPQRRQLGRLVREYGLEGRVEFPGFVPHRQVPDLLSRADLFVMPCIIDPRGDRDGLPNVILEAMAHEVPVVATDVNGVAEAIRPGETGWLIPQDEPAALAQAIREALADSGEARRRARAGRELAAREFDSTKNYARLKAWLER